MQQLPLQSDPLESNATPPQTFSRSKIKPLLPRDSFDNQLNETNYQKSLKNHSKTSKTLKTKAKPSASRGYQRILAAQRSLSTLSYSIHNNRYFENAYLFTKIRDFSGLKSLSMQFTTYSVNRIPLKLLFKRLVYLKDLNSFELEVNLDSHTNPKILSPLFQGLRRLKKFRSLLFSFNTFYLSQGAKMTHLPQYLSHLKRLESLTLNFEESVDLTNQDLISLGSVLPKLTFLTKISISFGVGRVIEGSTILKILNSIKNMSELTLNLGYCQLINQEGTDYLVEGLTQFGLSSIQKFRLHVHKNLETQNLFKLCQKLKTFSLLNLLHLDLHGCEALIDDSITALSSALSTISSLSSFSFRLSHTTKANSVIAYIASGLKSLHNLVHLKLNFESQMMNQPADIQQFSASLGVLTCLQFLDLCFTHCTSFSDDVLEKFGESLQKLVKLENLTLNLSSTRLVTNKGAEAIACAIGKLSSLLVLDLDFGYNCEIDEKAVDKISQALTNLACLDCANLRFLQCQKLKENENSFLSLFDALREMKNIRKVLIFIASNKVNKQQVNILKQTKTANSYLFK